MSGRNRIAKPSDLLKSPLLHLDDSKAWSQWFDAPVPRIQNCLTD